VNLSHFAMDTITLAGPLEARLRAVRAAGFGQVMLNAAEIAGHPGGEQGAVAALRASGLRVCGFQALRDFEGLSGHLHDYKVDVAKTMLRMCQAVGAKLLVAWSSTSNQASGDSRALVRDLRKLATLALPLGIRIGYEALSWGRHIDAYPKAAQIVDEADRANLGLVLDTFHVLAAGTALEELDYLDPKRIFLVQLSDFLWRQVRSAEERDETGRHARVFPGEGVHSAKLADFIRRLDENGYRGDYGFEVFNDDYLQLPPAVVAGRALRSAKWAIDHVSRRSLPLRRPDARAR
jgi:sugar phosphate isomerase/epimerase